MASDDSCDEYDLLRNEEDPQTEEVDSTKESCDDDTEAPAVNKLQFRFLVPHDKKRGRR